LYFLRDVVEGVDDDQAEGDEQDDPGRNDVRGDEERNPGERKRRKFILTNFP